MQTPPLKPLIISALPIFSSVLIATTLIWYFNVPTLTMPFVLGIIAGGLVDLDNRLTGRLKNIIITIILFTIASLTAQSTQGTGWPFILAMSAMTFFFTLFGAVSLRYRTFSFGALAVATYTTLTYTPETFWLINPIMILLGTVLYSLCTLALHLIFPNRPVQESMANAYHALGNYFDAKANFFDPDEIKPDQRQIDLAMSNTAVISTFNQCRNALFYRIRSQHRHLRTTRMLNYYFVVQDIHERISSAHVDYSDLVNALKNTDLIFRIHRLLEIQAQACRDIAQSLHNNHDYLYNHRLHRAMSGCNESLHLYIQQHPNSPKTHQLQQLLNNLATIDYQLKQLENKNLTEIEDNSTLNSISSTENNSLKNVWQTIKGQLNFESPIFRHAVRLSIVVASACIIVEIFQLNLGYWILLTALFVCQPNYSATKSRVYQRIIGTILGVIVGSLVPYFTPSIETKLWIIIVCTTLFFISRSYKYSFSTFFITIQALTSFSLAGLDVYNAMSMRIIDTLIGATLAWSAVSFLWPDWRYLTLNRTAAQVVNSNSLYLRKILDQLQNGSSDDINYRSIRRQAHEHISALSSTLSDMSNEPKKYGSQIDNGFNLLKTSYALMGYISALGAYRNQMAQDNGHEFANHFYSIAYEIADLLESVSQIQNNTIEPNINFQTALTHIQNNLDKLHEQLTNNQQNHVLWQQLSLIAHQIEPCYLALNAHKNNEALL